MERSWDAYGRFDRKLLRNNPCFLCSEASPERCHRRLVAESFQAREPGLQVVHLQ